MTGYTSFLSADVVASAPLPPIPKREGGWWPSPDDFTFRYTGLGPYAQRPWFAATGTGSDHRGGRMLPLVWNEIDLRGFRLVARDLDSRNQYAIGFLNLLTGYHVHKGYGWQACLRGQKKTPYAALTPTDPLVTRAQSILDAWRDAARWPLRSREAFRRWRRDGEVFGRFFFAGWDRLPAFRFVDPELVGSPTGDVDTPESFGIRTDPDDIETVLEYHVWDANDPAVGDWYSADRFVHARSNVDSVVKRGITDFLPVAEQFDGVRRLLRNMLSSTVRQAGTAWLERFKVATLAQVQAIIPYVAGQTTASSTNPIDPWEGYRGYGYDSPEPPGSVKRVEGDREFEPTPGGTATGGYIEALQAALRGCCARWGLPEFATSDASNNNFACHDSETELLTRRGWVRYDDIRSNDIAATMDPASGRFEWQGVQAVHVHNYDGDMIRVASRDLDLLVTPNHRMFTTRHRSERRNEKMVRVGLHPFGFKRADELRVGDVLPLCTAPANAIPVECFELPGVPHARKYLDGASHPRPRTIPMNPFLSFIGWFVSEGWTVSGGRTRMNYTVGVSQTTTSVAECESIRSAVRTLGGLTSNEWNEPSGMTKWQITDKSLWTWLRHNCGNGSYSKRLPDFVLDLSATQQRIVLDALLLGDGSHHGNGSAHYFTVSRTLADQVQAVALACGHIANVERPMRNGVIPVSIRRSDRAVKVGANHVRRERYRGVVWCVTVPNGLVFTRRNGKAIVTGNSALVANSPFTRTVEGVQYEWGAIWERPVALKVLELAAEAGYLSPSDLIRLDVEVIAPDVASADPQKDVTVYNTEHAAGVLSATTWQLKRGYDPRHEQANFDAEKQQGMQPGPEPTVPPVAAESRLTLEAGFTGTITDSAGRQRHYADGKEIAAPQQQPSSSTPTPNQSLAPADAKALTDSLATDLPEAAKDPSVWAKVKDAALTAAAKVHRRLLAMTPAGLAAMDILGAVLDTPDDLKKFGYNPSLSSGVSATDAAKGADPLATHLGVSTHFASTVITKVLSHAVAWAKGRRQSGEADGMPEVAELLAELFAEVHTALGVSAPTPDAATVLAALRNRPSTESRVWTEAEYATLSEADRAGLVKTQITNKAGNKQTVYVRPDDAAPRARAALDALGLPHEHLTDEQASKLHEQIYALHAKAGGVATKSAAVRPSGAHLDASEKEIEAAIRLDHEKPAKTEAEAEARAEAVLAKILDRHTPEEVMELARRVTGKSGKNAREAADILKADMTAVTRLVVSQDV